MKTNKQNEISNLKNQIFSFCTCLAGGARRTGGTSYIYFGLAETNAILERGREDFPNIYRLCPPEDLSFSSP